VIDFAGQASTQAVSCSILPPEQDLHCVSASPKQVSQAALQAERAIPIS